VGGAYLHDGRVLGVRAGRLGGLAHRQVLDVAASEDDVLEGVVSGGNGPVGGPVLGAEGAHCGPERTPLLN